MKFFPGDVIRIFDGTTRPPKHKRCICVTSDGWMLRINSEKHWRPNVQIFAANDPMCLDHDSYVELRGIVDYDVASLEEAISQADAEIMGRLCEQTIRNLLEAVIRAVTLTQREIDTIVEALRTRYGLSD